ncbi:MAG TPA: 30S ribosomal protein S1 [Syntrophales bacterium]|nr:30S ribosomal protein S1 [Syntrophales bacterium]
MDEEKQQHADNEEEKSFAELLAETSPDRGRLRPGERVEVTIVKITSEWIFLDLGGKSEGYLDRSELLDAEGNLTVQEGDTIRAYFLSAKRNEKLFTTKVSGGEAARSYIEDAWKSGIPVEGVVEKEVKGGYEVRIGGSLRAFCPHSQMGMPRQPQTESPVGKTRTFRVVEYGSRGRNIIVSRRSILEEEDRQRKEALKDTLTEGMTLRGTVVSLQKFGAFVDIGGIQGLLPISEIGWGHVEKVQDVLAVGQEIDAVLLRLDWANDRITLSLKSALPDPWETVENAFPEGSVHTGVIARLTKFGAFVTLAPGIDGLVHISKIGKGKRINHPNEVLTQGQTLEVRVEKVETAQKRISLTPAADAGAPAEEGDRNGDYQQYVPKSKESFGSFGDMMKGKLPERSRGKKETD